MNTRWITFAAMLCGVLGLSVTTIPAYAVPFTNGAIVIADDGANALYTVNPSTGARTLLTSGGILGSPRSVAFESATSVIVCNESGNVVRISDAGVQTLLTTGPNPNPDGTIRNFMITADKQTIYAGTIGGAEEIYRYSITGNAWTKLTTGPRPPDEPYGIVQSGNNLFYAERDEGGGQLVKVDLTGTAPNMPSTVIVTGIGNPRGLVLAPNGDLVTTINSANAIRRYTQAGVLVGTISISPTNGSLIDEPYQLAWENSSTLILADDIRGLVRIDFSTGTQTLLGPASGITGVDVFAVAAEAVPEPGTSALGLFGLAGLGLVAWRKRAVRG